MAPTPAYNRNPQATWQQPERYTLHHHLIDPTRTLRVVVTCIPNPMGAGYEEQCWYCGAHVSHWTTETQCEHCKGFNIAATL